MRCDRLLAAAALLSLGAAPPAAALPTGLFVATCLGGEALHFVPMPGERDRPAPGPGGCHAATLCRRS